MTVLLFAQALAFSLNNGNENGNNLPNDVTPEPYDANQDLSEASISRRNLLTWPIGISGALVYGKLLSSSLDKLSRGELVFPEDHEKRVRMVLSKSLVASAQSLTRANSMAEDGSPSSTRGK